MSDRHVDQLPSPGLKRALTLVRNLEELQRATTTLLDRVESVTTLRAGEVWVLTALASAPARLDALARHIGQPPDVTTTLVPGLTRRGLLDRTPGPDSPLLALTDDGTATLTQITGMQIRLLDNLTTALGPEGTQALDLVVRNLPAALRATTRKPA